MVGVQPVTGAPVQRGDGVTVRFVAGEWTAANANMPTTGPTGYDAQADRRLDGAKGCKVKRGTPFGALLAALPVSRTALFTPSDGELNFRAAGNGTLQLGMNDTAGHCSQGNRGTWTVRVSVTRPN
ncbi:hypothetical protein [Streptomyces sp. HD]|uniref:hypothetical protein n=1 Tax=Streptomyces sp. HD TaxID=3020892 RepID=UPI00232D62EF|nr:hypothetical protein [Streptomyces sp. HD]MDC0770883.1 hypothetical protein [Streptomyces sp. HD]